MNDAQNTGLSADELAAETATALPDKEVVSILDLNADLDLAIDAAAPIDLAVAANANVAAPIDAAVGANILSEGSTAQALSDQGVMINQGIDADANAESLQDSSIQQGDAPGVAQTASGDQAAPATGGATDGVAQTAGGATDAVGGAVGGATDGVAQTTGGATDGLGGAVDGATGGLGGAVDGATDGVGGAAAGVGSMADGNLLNVNVDLAADADISAPINGAVAANANVAAPINAAVSANIGSIDSNAVGIAQQDAIINQTITGEANATADQSSDISQPDQPQP